MTWLAEKLFEDFHKYPPKAIETFPNSFSIPQSVTLVGPAMYVLYRSAKCDPVTYIKPKKPLNYIHEHKPGVQMYRTDTDYGPTRKVPKYIHSTKALVLLGRCLGFGYTDDGDDDVDAEITGTVTELFAIPSGKALLVIEKRRKVLALAWGGKLNVEPRGIVG